MTSNIERDWDMIGGAGLTISRPIGYIPTYGDSGPKDGWLGGDDEI